MQENEDRQRLIHHHGGDRSGVRQHNERIIMQAIRRAGALPKADIARLTGLSPQAISVIVNHLLDEGLLIKTEKRRGKVGKPSTLIRLNPDGAHAVGVKIGRRSLDVLLMDLAGGISRRTRLGYRFPLPLPVLREVERGIDFVCDHLSAPQRARLLGVGVCMPSGLEGWAEELEAPPERLAEWAQTDIQSRIATMIDRPVWLMNDVAAATGAELALGTSITAACCLYLYVGAFIGGALVMSGRLVGGTQGSNRACAIGSLPLTGWQDVATRRTPDQLIRRASLIFLERALQAHDLTLDDLETPGGQAIYATWRHSAVPALAHAIVSAISIVDFEQVVIDGSLPRAAMAELVRETNTALDLFSLTGLRRPVLVLGSLGNDARALGSGLMPINARFGPE